jgi:hypothetical protein
MFTQTYSKSSGYVRRGVLGLGVLFHSCGSQLTLGDSTEHMGAYYEIQVLLLFPKNCGEALGMILTLIPAAGGIYDFRNF